MNLVTYRAFTAPELPEFEDMVLALYAEDPSGEAITRDKVRRTAAELLARPDKGRIVLFVAGEQTIGYAIVIPYWSNEYGGDIATIDEVYVRPPWRGRGIGSDFIEHVATEWRVVALRLEVTPRNERAMALYRRCGFEPDSNRHLFRKL